MLTWASRSTALAFPRAAIGGRIDIQPFPMQAYQGTLGVSVVHHRISILQLPFHIGFVVLG